MGSKLLVLHCGRQSKRGIAHKVTAPQHETDPREGVEAGGWSPFTGSHQQFTAGQFSSCAQPSSLSPATACVLQSSSPSRGEQRESQLLHEHAAHTDHSHGPTPHCPTAESEGEEERESVQNWIIHGAAQQLSASLFMFVKHR